MHPFELIYERAKKVNDNWESWFDPDIPEEEAYPSDLIQPMEAVEDMLEQGETLWWHVGWCHSLGTILSHWAWRAEDLIKLRLHCQWLADTLPVDPLDLDLAQRVRWIAEGKFCEAFPGLHNFVLRRSDQYLRDLDMNAGRRALEWEHGIPRHQHSEGWEVTPW